MPEAEPRLTRAEYWILESAGESFRPPSLLVSEDIEAHYNKPGHGLDRLALVDTLDRLVSGGLIGFADIRGAQNFEVPFTGQRDRPRIEAALAESHPDKFTYYGLTAEGGRVWEAFARPDWDA